MQNQMSLSPSPPSLPPPALTDMPPHHHHHPTTNPGAAVLDPESPERPSSSSGARPRRRQRVVLLSLNYASLFIGSVASSLLTRYYFDQGGNSRWLATWVQSTGFPLLFIPIYLSAGPRRPFSGAASFAPRRPLLCAAVGLMLGVNNFLFSWGTSYLPVSTSSLILSSQLAFNLATSVVLVRQRTRLHNVNAVVLLTLASLLLAFNSANDRPKGVTQSHFFLGFFATLGAAGLFAFYLPIMQIVLRGLSTYGEVMEMQMLMEATATVFSLVGMAAARGFREVRRDVEGYPLGKRAYWCLVATTAFSWQFCFAATAGSVFLTSSLNSGICMTALLSANVVAGVLVFKDDFGGIKGVATVMCVWGFSTYLYGEYKRAKKAEARAKQLQAAVDVQGKEME